MRASHVRSGTRAVTQVGSQPGFGQRLKEQRLRRGLTQTDLVSDGVSASYVSLIESGRREPTRLVVERLAERLGADAEFLLDGIGADAAQNGRMELAFARLCLGQGDAQQAADTLETLLAAGSLAGDPTRLFDARLALAQAWERLGRLDAAVKSLELLREQAQASPDALPWLPVVTALSRCYRESGDIGRAVDVAERAVDRCAELSLQALGGHTEVVATLALAHFERGDLLRASVLLDDLIERTRSAGRQDRAAAHWNAALVASGRGQHGDALSLAERAAALLSEGGDERAVARLKSTRAWIWLNQEPPEPDRAKALLNEALPALQQHDSAGAVASAEVELARAELLLGRPDLSRQHARRALERLGSEQPLEIARARAALGEAAAAEGHPAAARDDLDAAAALLVDVGADREAAALWRRIGDSSASLGDHERALAAYRSALDAAGLRTATTPASATMSNTQQP